MKVLYVGTLHRNNTTYARLRGLQEIESDVHLFDTDSYFKPLSRLRNSLERRLFIGPSFSRCNRDLLALCRKLQPDVVWVDKGYWIWPMTLAQIREGSFLVHHITDALYPLPWQMRWMYSLLRRTVSQYHILFTSNLDDFTALRGNTGTPVELTQLGFDHYRFNDAPLSPTEVIKWKSQMLFVGHYEPHTEQHIVALVEAGLSVTVYGPGWHRARNAKRLQNYIRFHPLEGQDYVNALKTAEIGLCVVSKWNYNQTAARSFEIPACGTFLLAVRTPQHLECYREGVEAEFFGNREELVRKARFYLQNPYHRNEVAKQGHQRCIDSGYSWADIMRRDWSKVQVALKRHAS